MLNHKTYILLIYLASMFASYAQDTLEIKGRLTSKETNAPVIYASIYDITTYKNGTTSNEDGRFLLKIFNYKQSVAYKIKIQSIGYKDTIIALSDLQKNAEISLIPEIYELPEVLISSGKKLKENYIGIPNGNLRKNDNGENKVMFPNYLAGFNYGIFVKPKKKTIGILKAIEVFIMEKGVPEAEFSIRILSGKNKLKHNLVYPSSAFVDYLQTPIVIKGKAGWNTIDLEEYEIPISENGFLILFIPLDYGDQYKWTDDRGGDWYGMVIGVYEKRKVSQLFRAFKYEETYAYDSQLKSNTPAVVVRYLEEE